MAFASMICGRMGKGQQGSLLSRLQHHAVTHAWVGRHRRPTANGQAQLGSQSSSAGIFHAAAAHQPHLEQLLQLREVQVKLVAVGTAPHRALPRLLQLVPVQLLEPPLLLRSGRLLLGAGGALPLRRG